MSQTGSTTRTVGSLGSSTDSGGGGGGGGSFPSHRKDQRNKQRKIVRILTVAAYILSVSTVALVLSVYYLFIWKPAPPTPVAPHLTSRYATDSPISAHHIYSQQTSSILQAPYGRSGISSFSSNNVGVNKARRNINKEQVFLPTPQGLEQIFANNDDNDQNDQNDQQNLGEKFSPSSPSSSPHPGFGDVKSTSTPERAPASAPELGKISRTTPNLLKIIAPTKSPDPPGPTLGN